MTDSKEWCDGDWRWRSSSKPFAGAESGSPGRALEAGKGGSPGRPVQAGIRGKRLKYQFIKVRLRYLNVTRAAWTAMELERVRSQLQGSSARPSHFLDAET